jgi:hypothetical protein
MQCRKYTLELINLLENGDDYNSSPTYIIDSYTKIPRMITDQESLFIAQTLQFEEHTNNTIYRTCSICQQ